MTTILVIRNEGLILADSHCVSSNGRTNLTEKIVRVPDGLVTGVGNQQACFACFEMIRRNADRPEGEDYEVPYVPPETPCNDNGFTVLHLKEDRTLWMYGDHFQPTPVLDDVYSIGTGDDIVRTALHLGKTSMEAMEIACKLDFNTGPPIVAISV